MCVCVRETLNPRLSFQSEYDLDWTGRIGVSLDKCPMKFGGMTWFELQIAIEINMKRIRNFQCSFQYEIVGNPALTTTRLTNLSIIFSYDLKEGIRRTDSGGSWTNFFSYVRGLLEHNENIAHRTII